MDGRSPGFQKNLEASLYNRTIWTVRYKDECDYSVEERNQRVVSPEDTTLEIVLLPFCRILYTCKLLFT